MDLHFLHVWYPFKQSTMTSWAQLLLIAALSCYSCHGLSPLRSATSNSGRLISRQTRKTKAQINHPPTVTLYSFSPDLQPEPERSQPLLEPYTPTPLVEIETYRVASIPQRPKVIVFGATTSLGRRIVKTLMESKVDVDVVAYVNDYDEWLRGNDGDQFVFANVVQRKGLGASLTVLEGDLIDSQVLNGTSVDESSLEMAEYNSQQLYQAISGSTAVISCLQSSRATNFYTDYLRVPFLRIWNRDVSSWCWDENHPYYIYLSHRRILQEMESEQRSRMITIEMEREKQRRQEEFEKKRSAGEDKRFDSSIAAELRRKRQKLGNVDTYSTSMLFQDLMSRNETMSIPLKSSGVTDRIKFIRISDMNMGRNPWRLGNILTNVFGSTVMRYEDMVDQLLKKSTLVDTVVLRVGDIVKEDRNMNNTSLQLSTSGVVPSPSVVGIDDMSELAAVTSLTKIHDPRYSNSTKSNVENDSMPPPKHFTWAVRWAGQYLQPPQGRRPDGSSSAALCFVKAMQAEEARARQKQIEKKKRETLKLYHGGKQLIRLRKWLKAPWRIKPYALSSVLTVYLTLAAVSWMLVGQTLLEFTTRLKSLNTAQIITKWLS